MSRWAEFGFPDPTGLPYYIPLAGLAMAFQERIAVYRKYSGPFSSLRQYMDDFEPVARIGEIWNYNIPSRYGERYLDTMPMVPFPFNMTEQHDTYAILRYAYDFSPFGSGIFNVNETLRRKGLTFDVEASEGPSTPYFPGIQFPFDQVARSLGIPFFDGLQNIMVNNKEKRDNLVLLRHAVALNVIYKLVNHIRFIVSPYEYKLEWEYRDYKNGTWHVVRDLFSYGVFINDEYHSSWPTGYDVHGEPHPLLGRMPDAYVWGTGGEVNPPGGGDPDWYEPYDTGIPRKDILHCAPKIQSYGGRGAPPHYEPAGESPGVYASIFSIYNENSFRGIYDCSGDFQFYDETPGDIAGEVPCSPWGAWGNLPHGRRETSNGVPEYLY